MAVGPRVLADGWYSWEVPSFRPLTDLIARWPRPLQDLSWRLGLLRAVMLFLASARYDLIAVTRADRGWRSLLLLRAVLGRRRKLVVLHFIDHPQRSTGLAARFDRLWRAVDRWAVRRAVLRAQVLSSAEQDLYARTFGVEPERFRFLPFAWRRGEVDPLSHAPAAERELVVAVGRALCDWPTLFQSAAPASWPLLVICGAGDRPLVERLNAHQRARVVSEIPDRQARELLGQAAVCVLPMQDVPISQGHVRLADAADAGAPVVATRVASLEGYVEDGRTAVLVPPGDAPALGEAIGRLLDDAGERERLARAAARRASQWTWEQYLRGVEEFVCQGTVTLPPAAVGAAQADLPVPGHTHARAV